METGENWVRIYLRDGNCYVTVTGKKYNHTSVMWEQRNDELPAGQEKVVRVDSATLIHSGNVEAALDRLAAYYQLRDTLTQTVVITNQKVGDMVESANPWGSITAGYITSMESEFTGSGHTAAITIRGSEKDTADAEVLKA